MDFTWRQCKSTFYKREWAEARGDEYDHWGTSVWYLEVGADGFPARQVELYANGVLLAYDSGHLDDEFGGLGDQPLDGSEFEPFEIKAAEFEDVWNLDRAANRKPPI